MIPSYTRTSPSPFCRDGKRAKDRLAQPEGVNANTGCDQRVLMMTRFGGQGSSARDPFHLSFSDVFYPSARAVLAAWVNYK